MEAASQRRRSQFQIRQRTVRLQIHWLISKRLSNPCQLQVQKMIVASPSTQNSTSRGEVQQSKWSFLLLNNQQSSRLTVHEGERLMVVNQADADGNSDWWYVRNSLGESGYVPRSYLVSEADVWFQSSKYKFGSLSISNTKVTIFFQLILVNLSSNPEKRCLHASNITARSFTYLCLYSSTQKF